MKRRLFVMAGILCIGVLLFGCSKEKTEEKKSVNKEESVKGEKSGTTYQVIGRESKDAYDILMTNKTGNVITGIQVKTSEQTEYPANMMGSSQKIAKDETVEFFYMSETAEKDKSDEADLDGEDTVKDTPEITDSVINIGYSLKLTFEDGSVHELTSFAVDDIEEVDICYEEEVAFFAYESKSMEMEISTKEAELALRTDRQAAKAVTDQIQKIGEVTLESEAAIQAARATYDALTDIQKKMVTNESLLTEQEAVLAVLKQQAAEQAAAEQAAAEQAAAEQRAAEQAAATQRAAQQNNYNSSNGEGSSSDYAGEGASQETGGCLDDVLIN